MHNKFNDPNENLDAFKESFTSDLFPGNHLDNNDRYSSSGHYSSCFPSFSSIFPSAFDPKNSSNQKFIDEMEKSRPKVISNSLAEEIYYDKKENIVTGIRLELFDINKADTKRSSFFSQCAHLGLEKPDSINFDEFNNDHYKPYILNCYQKYFNEISDYAAYNFSNCNSDGRPGLYIEKNNEKGDTERYFQCFSCGCSKCMFCKEKKRNKESKALYDMILELNKKYSLDHAYSLCLTFSDESRSLFLENNLKKTNKNFCVFQNTFIKHIKKRLNIKRSYNISFRFAVHPAGSGFFNKNLHFHCLLLPIVMPTKSNKILKPEVLDIKIDESIILDCLKSTLKALQIPENSSKVYLKTHKVSSKKDLQHLKNDILYIYRCFSYDLKKGLKFKITTKGKTRFVFMNEKSTAEGIYCDYYILPIQKIVQHYEYINSRNKIQSYGWLRQVSSYDKYIDIKDESGLELIADLIEECTIDIQNKSTFDVKKNKVIHTRKEYVVRKSGERLLIGIDIMPFYGIVVAKPICDAYSGP
jgi:hypothetical protein